MPLFRRKDGTPIKNLSSLRRFMPHLIQGKNEGAVYYSQTLDVSKTMDWLEDYNRTRPPEEKITFFHITLLAVIRTLRDRPKLNRFIVGRRVYQRNQISLSFAVKKEFNDEATLSTVKIVFEPTDTLEDVAQKVQNAIHGGRSSELSTSEKEMKAVASLPTWMIRTLMSLQRTLDAWNLLPHFMIEPDPLYASLFMANLGSIGLDAPFHHLYEYGTVPIFLVIGKIKKAPVVNENHELAVGDVVQFRYTLDERIADGFYCSRSLEILQEWIEDPQTIT